MTTVLYSPIRVTNCSKTNCGAHVHNFLVQTLIVHEKHVILFALSITAYRNTGIKKILFAAAAFALFAIQLFVDSIEGYLVFLGEDATDILVALITFVILVLFFVAIVKKR